MLARLLLPTTLLVALVACTGTPEPSRPAPQPVPEGVAPSWSGDTLARDGQAALVLDRMPATFTFSGGNQPAGEGAAGTFMLTEIDQRDGKKHVWTVRLPFRVPEAERRFRPTGMRVFVGDDELDFSMSPAGRIAGRANTFRFNNDDLVITYKGNDVAAIRVEHPEAARRMRRMDWPTAQADGMSAADYAHFGVSIDKESREGLLLPAPSEAAWADVTIPEGATFRAWLTRAPSPLEGSSDGATAVLALQTADGEVELGRAEVAGAITGFDPWTIDLSAHAGAAGTLVLRTLPGASADYDYVLVGSPAITTATSEAARHVFVIGIDTLRPDHLGTYGYPRGTSPELDEFAATSVVFDRAWTSAPRTRPSFRAATTGRLPLEAVCAKNIGEVFDEAGFATAGVVANVHLNPRFDFDKGFDYWFHVGEAQVDEQVRRAKRWLADNEGRDTYMFLHLMDPHIGYRPPERILERFTADLPPLPDDQRLPKVFNRWEVYQWMNQGKLTDLQKLHITARYDAEIAFLSEGLGELFDTIDALPGDSLIVVHNDHGEELWDHGGFEHNHTLYDDVTRAVMWVRPPGGTGVRGARSTVPATLQDIAPTLYDFLGFEDTPPTDGQSLLPAVRGVADGGWTRPIPIGHLRYDADRWGVVWNDHKYVLITGSGEEELYNLANDPTESKNLAGTVDTEPYWRKMAEAHGVPVGHGWRIEIDVPTGTTATLTLPTAAVGADVLDPEKIVRHPANQVWGETPNNLSSDVATVSHDGATVTITGGPKGKGVVWVLFDAATAPTGTVLTAGGATAELGADGQASAGGVTLTAKAGVVLVPPPDEAARMQACAAGEAATSDEIDLLRELGYVGEEGANH